MELEQMTYPEVLRWLANKYHIEIQERDDQRGEAARKRTLIDVHRE